MVLVLKISIKVQLGEPQERTRTLTVLSQPEETMMGLLLEGEKRTHDTQSSWQSSVMVYLHWARVFHSCHTQCIVNDRTFVEI